MSNDLKRYFAISAAISGAGLLYRWLMIKKKEADELAAPRAGTVEVTKILPSGEVVTTVEAAPNNGIQSVATPLDKLLTPEENIMRGILGLGGVTF